MKYVVLIILIFLSACSSRKDNDTVSVLSSDETGSRERAWYQLAGTWSGEQKTDEGGLYKWTMTHFLDGKYILAANVERSDGSFYSQVEVGEWGVSGNIKFTIFKGWLVSATCQPSDNTNPTNYDVYQILSLSNSQVEYKDLSDGDIFVMKKESGVGSEDRITSKASGCFAPLL